MGTQQRIDTGKDRRIVLNKVRFKLAATIGRAVAQMTTIEKYEAMAEAIKVVVQTNVLAERIVDRDLRVDFPFPATWWEHLKLTVLPKIPHKWRKRIKVKLSHYYHTLRVRQYVGYPEANEVLEDRWGKPVIFEMWEDVPGDILFDNVKANVEEIVIEHPGKKDI